MSKMRLKRALHYDAPPAAVFTLREGDGVLVWRETVLSNLIGEWLAYFKAESIDYARELVFVRDCDTGPPRPFKFVQVKKYLRPPEAAKLFFAEIHRSLKYFTTS